MGHMSQAPSSAGGRCGFRLPREETVLPQPGGGPLVPHVRTVAMGKGKSDRAPEVLTRAERAEVTRMKQGVGEKGRGAQGCQDQASGLGKPGALSAGASREKWLAQRLGWQEIWVPGSQSEVERMQSQEPARPQTLGRWKPALQPHRESRMLS